IRTLKREGLHVGRIRLGYARVDQMAAPLLHMMKRNPDEAYILRKIGRSPRDATRLVVQRRGDIPETRRVALSLVVGPLDGVAAKNLNRDRLIMRHRPRLDGAVERAEQ